MKLLKRFTGLLLVLTMVLGLVTVPANAEGETLPDGYVSSEWVVSLNDALMLSDPVDKLNLQMIGTKRFAHNIIKIPDSKYYVLSTVHGGYIVTLDSDNTIKTVEYSFDPPSNIGQPKEYPFNEWVLVHRDLRGQNYYLADSANYDNDSVANPTGTNKVNHVVCMSAERYALAADDINARQNLYIFFLADGTIVSSWVTSERLSGRRSITLNYMESLASISYNDKNYLVEKGFSTASNGTFKYERDSQLFLTDGTIVPMIHRSYSGSLNAFNERYKETYSTLEEKLGYPADKFSIVGCGWRGNLSKSWNDETNGITDTEKIYSKTITNHNSEASRTVTYRYFGNSVCDLDFIKLKDCSLSIGNYSLDESGSTVLERYNGNVIFKPSTSDLERILYSSHTGISSSSRLQYEGSFYYKNDPNTIVVVLSGYDYTDDECSLGTNVFFLNRTAAGGPKDIVAQNTVNLGSITLTNKPIDGANTTYIPVSAPGYKGTNALDTYLYCFSAFDSNGEKKDFQPADMLTLRVKNIDNTDDALKLTLEHEDYQCLMDEAPGVYVFSGATDKYNGTGKNTTLTFTINIVDASKGDIAAQLNPQTNEWIYNIQKGAVNWNHFSKELQNFVTNMACDDKVYVMVGTTSKNRLKYGYTASKTEAFTAGTVIKLSNKTGYSTNGYTYGTTAKYYDFYDDKGNKTTLANGKTWIAVVDSASASSSSNGKITLLYDASSYDEKIGGSELFVLDATGKLDKPVKSTGGIILSSNKAVSVNGTIKDVDGLRYNIANKALKANTTYYAVVDKLAASASSAGTITVMYELNQEFTAEDLLGSQLVDMIGHGNDGGKEYGYSYDWSKEIPDDATFVKIKNSNAVPVTGYTYNVGSDYYSNFVNASGMAVKMAPNTVWFARIDKMPTKFNVYTEAEGAGKITLLYDVSLMENGIDYSGTTSVLHLKSDYTFEQLPTHTGQYIMTVDYEEEYNSSGLSSGSETNNQTTADGLSVCYNIRSLNDTITTKKNKSYMVNVTRLATADHDVGELQILYALNDNEAFNKLITTQITNMVAGDMIELLSSDKTGYGKSYADLELAENRYVKFENPDNNAGYKGYTYSGGDYNFVDGNGSPATIAKGDMWLAKVNRKPEKGMNSDGLYVFKILDTSGDIVTEDNKGTDLDRFFVNYPGSTESEDFYIYISNEEGDFNFASGEHLSASYITSNSRYLTDLTIKETSLYSGHTYKVKLTEMFADFYEENGVFCGDQTASLRVLEDLGETKVSSKEAPSSPGQITLIDKIDTSYEIGYSNVLTVDSTSDSTGILDVEPKRTGNVTINNAASSSVSSLQVGNKKFTLSKSLDAKKSYSATITSLPSDGNPGEITVNYAITDGVGSGGSGGIVNNYNKRIMLNAVDVPSNVTNDYVVTRAFDSSTNVSGTITLSNGGLSVTYTENKLTIPKTVVESIKSDGAKTKLFTSSEFYLGEENEKNKKFLEVEIRIVEYSGDIINIGGDEYNRELNLSEETWNKITENSGEKGRVLPTIVVVKGNKKITGTINAGDEITEEKTYSVDCGGGTVVLTTGDGKKINWLCEHPENFTTDKEVETYLETININNVNYFLTIKVVKAPTNSGTTTVTF